MMPDLNQGPGVAAGPLDPVLEELKADYDTMVRLLDQCQNLAVVIYSEMDKARPSEREIRKAARGIYQRMKTVKDMAGARS